MLQVSPEGRILLHELILRRDAADARIDDVLIEQGIATKCVCCSLVVVLVC